MNILYWTGLALVLLALPSLLFRRFRHPLMYALGFWGGMLQLVHDLATGRAWYLPALDALLVLAYSALMMDCLSSQDFDKQPGADNE